MAIKTTRYYDDIIIFSKKAKILHVSQMILNNSNTKIFARSSNYGFTTSRRAMQLLK